jgi:sugar fermentation stimulation protein A
MTTTPLLTVDSPIECRTVARLNRFVVEVQLGERHFRASTNNTGRLVDFISPGKQVYCHRHPRPSRTDFSLFAVDDSPAGALIDTQLQMRAFERAVSLEGIPWLAEAGAVRRNVALGESVIDYLLQVEGEELFLEVKSSVLRDGEYAMYPDCPSLRGRRHVRALTQHVQRGGKAVIVFVAALPRVSAFKPNRLADPELHGLLVDAARAGVGIKALNIIYVPIDSTVQLVNPDLPVNLSA